MEPERVVAWGLVAEWGRAREVGPVAPQLAGQLLARLVAPPLLAGQREAGPVAPPLTGRRAAVPQAAWGLAAWQVAQTLRMAARCVPTWVRYIYAVIGTDKRGLATLRAHPYKYPSHGLLDTRVRVQASGCTRLSLWAHRLSHEASAVHRAYVGLACRHVMAAAIFKTLHAGGFIDGLDHWCHHHARHRRHQCKQHGACQEGNAAGVRYHKDISKSIEKSSQPNANAAVTGVICVHVRSCELVTGELDVLSTVLHARLSSTPCAVLPLLPTLNLG